MSAELFRFSFAPLNPILAIALNASSVSITCKFRGLVLIGSFNLGLTSMLVSLGYASVVYGRQWLEKAPIVNGTKLCSGCQGSVLWKQSALASA